MYKQSKHIFLTLLLLVTTLTSNGQPLMGWSSWNTYHVNISDSLIRAQADAMVKLGLKDVGYNYINIDDGFFGYRDEKGMMHPHPQRFLHGLKGTADYIHSLGLNVGIYSDAGYVTCGSIYDNDKNGIGAGLLGHERQDADLYFNQWGFDFIKIDYCGAGTELDLDEETCYTKICNTIKNTSNHPVKINICRWAFPGTWAADIADSWRISSDIRPRWSSIRNIINKNMYLSAFASRGHYNDMDMLEVGRGLTADEEDTHFAMWCMLSSPLLIGCDLNKLPERSLNLLKNKYLIALDQDSLGLQANVVKRIGEKYIFVKDIEKRYGTTRAVAFYNPSDHEYRFSIHLNELQLKGDTKIFEMITQAKMPNSKDSIIVVVPKHGTRILRLEAKKRIEANRYEAEWAYLPCYNDLGKQRKPINFAEDSTASGGVIVKNIGGKTENVIRWNNIYSIEGGNYLLEISFIPAKNRKMDISVNGNITYLDSIPADGGITKTSLPITLKNGENCIEIGSKLTWAPDIDCIYLVKQK